MKKVLLSATLITLLSVACSRSEIDNSADSTQSASSQISFGSYVGLSTKSVATTLINDDDTLSMGVFGYYTDETQWLDAKDTTVVNFMYNQPVITYDGGGTWSYSPIKYWSTEQDDYFTFFAYAPYQSSSNGFMTLSESSEYGTPTITLSIEDGTLGDMVDFVAAGAIDVTKVDNLAQIQFTHKHETCRVNLTAQLSEALSEEDNSIVIIKSITLSDEAGGALYSAATYTFSDSGDIGSWGGYDSMATALDLSDILASESVTWGANSEYGEQGIVLSSSQTALFESDDYLFLIPVDYTQSSCSSDVSITIVYDVVTSDSCLSSGYSAIENSEVISLPSGLLLQGKAYSFNLQVGVSEVELSASIVNSWDGEIATSVTTGESADSREV